MPSEASHEGGTVPPGFLWGDLQDGANRLIAISALNLQGSPKYGTKAISRLIKFHFCPGFLTVYKPKEDTVYAYNLDGESRSERD